MQNDHHSEVSEHIQNYGPPGDSGVILVRGEANALWMVLVLALELFPVASLGASHAFSFEVWSQA